MKIVLTKKENIIRIFAEKPLLGYFAFWLGKSLRDVEMKTGYKFFLQEGMLPQGEKTFWGMKVLDFEEDKTEKALEELIKFIKDLLEKEKLS